jgi:ketosteroid isomerase-like protein
MENPDVNVKNLREAYKSWNDSRGASLEKWMDLMDENIVFRSLAGGAKGMEFTLECRNKSDVERYFKGLGTDWEMLHYTPEEFTAQEDRVVVFGKCGWKSKKTSKSVETPKADFFKFRNGKIVEFFEFYDTARAIAAGLPD